MTVRLELKPEVEERVIAQAKAQGISVDAYLQRLVENVTRANELSLPPIDADGIRAMLDELAEMGKGLPVLPDSALTRESIYQDHD